jgi:hypothetical protein
MNQQIFPDFVSSWVVVGQRRQDGSFLLRFEIGSFTCHLVSAWTYGRAEVQFKMLSAEPPFNDEDKRLELLARLNQLRGVSLGLEAIDRRPSISLEILAAAGAVGRFCAALEWLIQEARATATQARSPSNL